MKVTAIKTHKITGADTDITTVLDKYLPSLAENSIVVLTSKIVSICEGRQIPIEDASKDELVDLEAEYYLPKEQNKYNVFLTVKNSILAASAGIDESNTNGNFVFWPKDPQKSANKIREYLSKKHKIKNLGVLITDSKTTPLRWGVTGIGLSHSGFSAINDIIGTPDIFGRLMQMTKVNVMDGLSASAAVVMGEGAEQTPLGILTGVPFVKFQQRNPTDEEINMLNIDIDDDVYSTFLKSVPWKKGKGKT